MFLRKIFSLRLQRQVQRLFVSLLLVSMVLGIDACCHAVMAEANPLPCHAHADAIHSITVHDSALVVSVPEPKDDCCCVTRPRETAWQDPGLATQGHLQDHSLTWMHFVSIPYLTSVPAHFQFASVIPRGPPPVHGPALFISQTILLI